MWCTYVRACVCSNVFVGNVGRADRVVWNACEFSVSNLQTRTSSHTQHTDNNKKKPHECALTKQPANSIKQDFMHPVAVGDGDAFFCQSCRRSTLNSALWRAFTSYFHGVANDLHACAAAADREDDFSFMIRLAAPASPCTALLLLLLLLSVCALARLRNIWISGLRTMCVRVCGVLSSFVHKRT